MKRKLVVYFMLLAMAMAIGAGCAENSFFCKNRTIITSTLDGIIIVANFLLSSTLPQEVRELLVKAKDAALTGLGRNCPTDSDVQIAQNYMTQATQKAEAMGVKLEAKAIKVKK